MNQNKPLQFRSGILLVDKNCGSSSASVVDQIKRHFEFSRVGHGGTLDPFATGLLVILIGEATKVARFLLEGNKEYLGVAKLGIETTTDDNTGGEIQTCLVPTLTIDQWQAKASELTGKQLQTPPKFSAKKIQGKRAYALARQGVTIELKPTQVHIYSFNIEKIDANIIYFKTLCSGGTYIRTLAKDLAKSAGSIAHLQELRRTKSGQFTLEQANTLSHLLENNLEKLPLIPVEQAVSHLPLVECTEAQSLKIRQGNLSVFNELLSQIHHPGYFRVLCANRLVAIANHHPQLIPNCLIERVFELNSD